MQQCILGKTSDEKWIRQLLEHGRLRMSKLATYRKLESKVIGDPHEGVSMYFSGKNPGLKVTLVTQDDVELPVEGLVQLTVDSADRDLGVYCMTAFQTKGDGTLSIDEILGPFVKEPRIRDFGETLAIFRDSPEFVRRIEAAAKRAGFELLAQKVDYQPHDYCGDITPWDKVGDYAYQQEWRFVTTEPIPEEHLYLELGSLMDIANVLDLRDVVAA